MADSDSLLARVNAATADDLHELETEVVAAQSRLDGITALRDFVAARLASRKAKAAKVADGIAASKAGKRKLAKPADDAEPARNPDDDPPAVCWNGPVQKKFRIAAAQAIDKADGPVRPAILAGEINCPLEKIGKVLSCEWFAEGPHGFHLTPDGRQAAL